MKSRSKSGQLPFFEQVRQADFHTDEDTYSVIYSNKDNHYQKTTGKYLDAFGVGQHYEGNLYSYVRWARTVDEEQLETTSFLFAQDGNFHDSYIRRTTDTDGNIEYNVQVNALYFDGWDEYRQRDESGIFHVTDKELFLNDQMVRDINGLDYSVSMGTVQLFLFFTFTEDELEDGISAINEVFRKDGEDLIKPFSGRLNDFIEDRDHYVKAEDIVVEIDKEFIKNFFGIE